MLILGEAATPELMAAWKQGYKILSGNFMKLEDDFRQNPYYQTWEISPETIKLLKQSAKIIKTKGKYTHRTHLFLNHSEKRGKNILHILGYCLYVLLLAPILSCFYNILELDMLIYTRACDILHR